MVINFGTNFANFINFKANTSVKASKCLNDKTMVKFGNGKLSGLEYDTVSIGETYFNREDIHSHVRVFSNLLKSLSKSDSMSKGAINNMVKSIAPDCAIEVRNIKSCPRFANRVAVCDTDYLKGTANSVLYINFDVEDERIIQNTVHEFTHALQDNTYAEKVLSDQSRKQGGVAKLSNAFVDLEKQFLEFNFFDGAVQRSQFILENLNNSQDKNPLESFNYCDEKCCKKYDVILDKLLDDNGITDRQFAYKFFKAQALNEADAYREGFLTKKELANIPKDQYIIQDLLPKMYEDLAKYLDKKLS